MNCFCCGYHGGKFTHKPIGEMLFFRFRPIPIGDTYVGMIVVQCFFKQQHINAVPWQQAIVSMLHVHLVMNVDQLPQGAIRIDHVEGADVALFLIVTKRCLIFAVADGRQQQVNFINDLADVRRHLQHFCERVYALQLRKVALYESLEAWRLLVSYHFPTQAGFGLFLHLIIFSSYIAGYSIPPSAFGSLTLFKRFATWCSYYLIVTNTLANASPPSPSGRPILILCWPVESEWAMT